jgi:hypothetical protein
MTKHEKQTIAKWVGLYSYMENPDALRDFHRWHIDRYKKNLTKHPMDNIFKAALAFNDWQQDQYLLNHPVDKRSPLYSSDKTAGLIKPEEEVFHIDNMRLQQFKYTHPFLKYMAFQMIVFCGRDFENTDHFLIDDIEDEMLFPAIAPLDIFTEVLFADNEFIDPYKINIYFNHIGDISENPSESNTFLIESHQQTPEQLAAELKEKRAAERAKRGGIRL